jgi:hypothetical protein
MIDKANSKISSASYSRIIRPSLAKANPIEHALLSRLAVLLRSLEQRP